MKYYKFKEIFDLKDMLEKSANRFKKRAAFKLKDSDGKIYRVSYDTFKNDVFNLGTGLLNLNLKDKKIAVIGNNSYNWCISYLASCIAGVVVPIDKELHSADVINFINVSDCSAVIGDSKYLKNISENSSKLSNKDLIYIDEKELALIKEKGKNLADSGDTSFSDIKIDPDQMRILLFTSGTTGTAKGVCLSHKNICANLMSTAKMIKIRSNDSVLSILPLHHTYECTLGFLLVLYRGATIAHCEGLKYISQNILEYRPTILVTVPLLLENVYKKIMKNLEKSLPKKYFENKDKNIMDILPFPVKQVVKRKIKASMGSRLRLLVTGAASMNPVIVETLFKFGFTTLQGYGLTETSPLIVGNYEKNYRYNSQGIPVPDVEVKIDNPNEDGIGEIIAKGANVMLGYFNNEEETNKVLKNGWFYTGDLGTFDKDGFLYITGRSKSVIVTKNGKKIYPEEVEHHLYESPLISEALVTGLNYDNDDDTYVNATIFPNMEAIGEYLKVNIPTKEEIYGIMGDIIQSVNKKLPNYKHIKSFKIRDEEFEKTTTKKIKRFGDNLK